MEGRRPALGLCNCETLMDLQPKMKTIPPCLQPSMDVSSAVRITPQGISKREKRRAPKPQLYCASESADPAPLRHAEVLWVPPPPHSHVAGRLLGRSQSDSSADEGHAVASAKTVGCHSLSSCAFSTVRV